MSSVKFQPRGRQRVPLSLFAPLIVNNEKPLFKVLPNNAVPKGMGNRDQQIGYWNEQPRWRMQRGKRVELPSKWHFYFLGTGPHAEVPFRTRTEGVFWVAREGAKTEPTKLNTRKSSEKPLVPDFGFNLPSAVEVVEPTTPVQSRSNSRSQSRGSSSRRRSPSGSRQNQMRFTSQTPGNSRSRVNSQNRGNQARGGNPGNQSRNQSRSRNQSMDRSGDTGNRDDLISAVKEALKSLGIGQNSKAASARSSGRTTPKKNKSRSQSKERPLLEVPEWRRVPKGQNTVELCFGPRGGFKNFGGPDFVEKGIEASGYPQAAALVPNGAALLFGGNVTARELQDSVELTYTYKMTVPKDDPNLQLLLAQIDAYKEGVKPQRKKERKSRASQSDASNEHVDVVTDGAVPDKTVLEWDTSADLDSNVEIVNEVFDVSN
ncbi:nucleocapsid [Alphacoronavirus sp.]|uniref:Nucleoprotein n=1 Tax=alphacoronavirus sp. WA1087 TaxID=3069910 RepID=A0AA48UFJ6_9ALPC|nr:nucleocapsid [Alphacoronavirus sp.]QGX41949.1 nucleocapsid [alphacoronavirus sp. WA1087]